MTDVPLPGLRPEPLGSYLAAFGVFRLVAEQVDPDAQGRWTSSGFRIDSSLDREGIESFLLERYEPTPLVAPWNSGSGFRRSGTRPTADLALEAIEMSQASRFELARRSIAVGRQALSTYFHVIATIDADHSVSKSEAKAAKNQAFKDLKLEVLRYCRNYLPDKALSWLDACVVLTSDGPAYPDILGSGGVLGSQDLTSNYNECLAELFDLDSGNPRTPDSPRWLASALDGDLSEPRRSGPVGQYEPGAAGGVNSSTLDGGPSFVNPWQFVLTLEGSLLFASAAARRLGSSGNNVAAMPFTVRPAAVGAGHLSDEETAKSELWLPLWSQGVSLAELRRLIGEGRLRWGNSQATTGIDAARAVATLGVDRGVEAFTRVSIAERLGQSPLAVPVGRMTARRSRHVEMTGELDAWLRRAGSGRPPGALRKVLHAADCARYEVAASTNDSAARRHLLELLRAAADIDRLVGVNSSLRKEVNPCPPLDPSAWVPLLDDGSPEFAMAIGLVSLRDDRARGDDARAERSYRSSFTEHLRPIQRDGRRLVWNGRPALVADPRRLGLAASAARTHIIHARHGAPLNDTSEPRHRTTGFSRGTWVDKSVIQGFVAGDLDSKRIADLVCALGLVDAYGRWPIPHEPARLADPPTVPAWTLLAPLFAGRSVTVGQRPLEDDQATQLEVRLAPRPDWPRRLAAGGAAMTQVLREAMVALGAAGLTPVPANADRLGTDTDGRRLAAALLVDTSDHAFSAALAATTEPRTMETATGST